MPIFTYTALKSGKDTINGRIEALSLREAREALRKMDLVPTKLEEIVQVSKAAKVASQVINDKSLKDIKNQT